MCDVLYQMLEEFLPFPEDADNSALLNYYLKVIKSIQTEYSLSSQVLIDNGIPTEFAIPLSSFEHHELLLSQLQNIIKFYKQIESNSLNILELYTLIIQRLKEISEIKNDVYKYKLELLCITRYIELLSLYENIEIEGKSSENKFEDKIVQTELYQALKIERAFEEKNKNNGKTEELIEKDNTINEQDPNTLRMNSKVQAQITELQSEIKEIQSDNKQKTEQIKQLQHSLNLLNRCVETQAHNLDEAQQLTKLMSEFANGLTLLDDFDNKNLDIRGKTVKEAVFIDVPEFLDVIDKMKPEFGSDIFANPKDESFNSSVRQIYQTFGGKDCYPSLEEKAAMLLYLVVKNHSFSDGNKRIGANCFLYFMQKNGMLYKNGESIISNATLATLTILIAESKPEEMETVKQVVISILNRN